MGSRTKQAERDRRAKIEAMRRAEQAAQRRRSIAFLVVAVLVGIGLIAAVVVPSYLSRRNDPANKTLSALGVSTASARCGGVRTTTGTNNDKDRAHLADGATGTYRTVPPSYGGHAAQSVSPADAFYTAADRPAMESLVHNLEHGYTVVWYDKTIKNEALKVLQAMAASGRRSDAVNPGAKLIVSAWDESYGSLPAGKHIGISHWGAKDSYVQLCGKPSGAVLSTFLKRYPAADSPEGAAA